MLSLGASLLLLGGCGSISFQKSSEGVFSSSDASSSLVLSSSSSVASSTASSSSSSSSSASVSSASSSGASNSSSSALSSVSSFPVLASYDYRIAPNYSSSAAKMPIYNVAHFSSGYQAQKATEITQETDCLNAEQAAEYYVSFRSFPPNYFGSTDQAVSYGKNGRVVNTYYSGGYHTYDYTVKLGTWNVPSDGAYYEFEIDLTGNYNNGTRINHGAGRLVVIADGIKEYGSEPVCYYTTDHYADFKEYYNFYQGWSPLFAGVYNKSGSYENTPITDLERPSVPTVPYTIVD